MFCYQKILTISLIASEHIEHRSNLVKITLWPKLIWVLVITIHPSVYFLKLTIKEDSGKNNRQNTSADRLFIYYCTD
jgi:hypothetical protein